MYDTQREDRLPSSFVRVKGLPVLGSLIPISRNALKLFSSLLKQYGDRVLLRLPFREVLLLCHPDDIEQVMVHDRSSYGRSAELRKLRTIFGRGLVSSEGDLWRRQRLMIQPGFKHESLADYAAIMLSTIRSVLDTWRDNQVRDIHADAMLYTRKVISGVLFGKDTLPNSDAVGEAVSTVFGDLRSEVLYLPLWRLLPLQRSRKWNRAVCLLNEALSASIRNRCQSDAQHDDLLGMLLTARDEESAPMSDGQVLDEILTFFLAGHETAALSLSWATYLLATHPEVQQRVADEIDEVCHGGDLRREHVALLSWTNAVIKEALRLYPPVWSIGREATSNTALGGRIVSKGMNVWICVHRVHHDERWYAEPECFSPERWLKGSPPRHFSYILLALVLVSASASTSQCRKRH